MKKYYKFKHAIIYMLVIFMLIFTAGKFAFAERNLKAPSSPVNLTVTEVTENSVTLKWDKPKTGSNIRAYKVYKNSTYDNSTKTTTYTIDNLKPDTEYEFYIRSEAEKNNVSLACEAVTVKTKSNMSTNSKIIGYYPAWKSYSGYTPDKLDASKLTHINYAFANIGKDNKIKLGYPDKDPENFKMLNELKKINSELKILISVGGWNWSGQFSDAAATQIARTAFAESCVDFITKFGIDGIDLDWEYPVGGGLDTNLKRPQDKQNFTLLLKEVREKLDEQGMKDNKKYLLTIAGGASSYYLKNVEPDKIKEYVDFANIMAYDLHGPWDAYSDYNAPLYNNTKNSPQYKISVDSSVSSWINAGFPKEKLVVGVPFYGYIYNVDKNNNHGLYQKHADGEALSYNSIKLNYLNDSYEKMFDTESMVPWLYNDKAFISYDDTNSMKLKAEYVKNEDLAGIMIWELSQDYKNELLNSIYEILK